MGEQIHTMVYLYHPYSLNSTPNTSEPVDFNGYELLVCILLN